MKTSLRIQLNIYSMKTIDLRPFQNNFAVVLHLENVNDCDNEQSYIKSYTVIWWDLWYFVSSRKKRFIQSDRFHVLEINMFQMIMRFS